jgi:hypothetical protein
VVFVIAVVHPCEMTPTFVMCAARNGASKTKVPDEGMLLNPDTPTAATFTTITTPAAPTAAGLKTKTGWLRLLPQVGVIRADLHDSHGPQIFSTAALYPGCSSDIHA